ncbi:MAG TPA: lanthionine synthetase LanC family protein, partial [Chthoniobacterales bacterium]|nr:lanthionine synthetase LanC family protein [Chthoniobacterales bacterium]
ILFATMRWCRSSGTAFPSQIEERLEQLSELAECVGRRARWKCLVGEDHCTHGGMYAAGWCHGSAGFVHLWTLAGAILGNSEYRVLAERAGLDVAESESPLGNLCCGLAGQAYALLNLYKHTLDQSWLRRAQNQAELAIRSMVGLRATRKDRQLALRNESLYKGELGVAVLASDLQNPEFAAMPFFESEC